MKSNRHDHLTSWQKLRRPTMSVLICLMAGGILWWHRDTPSVDSVLPAPTRQTADRLKSPEDKSGIIALGFKKSQYSLNDPASLWVLVNKGRKLPSDYAPKSLVAPAVTKRFSVALLRYDAAAKLEALFEAAAQSNLKFLLVSGYRSYSTQTSVYAGYVGRDGQTAADTYSARPGHSEHQTGLAADVGSVSRTCELDQCFGDTAEGQWLAANSYKYGFVVRYQEGKEKLTGYTYEPWHLRFVGVELAEQIQNSGQTLEQFFGLPAYPTYPTTPLLLK